MAKFQGKYRSESHRMPNWNYSANGSYFITLMVDSQLCIFGEISKGTNKLIPNDWGKIVLHEWEKSFEMRSELSCDAFILMPNHLHAIITIENSNNQLISNLHSRPTHGSTDARPCVSAGMANAQSGQDGADQTANNDAQKSKFHRKPKSISSFMAGFKSECTTQINNHIDDHLDDPLFPSLKKFHRKNRLWQFNYHDHIIRNPFEFLRIKTYIENTC